MQDPKQAVLLFNECINTRNLDGLARLMTEDHVFVDRDGNVHQPKSYMVQAWEKFFEMFPGYRNTFTHIEFNNGLVVVLGHAYWSKEKAYDPVIWTASVTEGQIRKWQVHEDTPENRLKFHLV